MIRTFINSFKVSFAESANTFIYFLKRVPFLGKKIPDRLYKETQTKLILGIIREILGVIGSFFGKAIYLGLMIILPSYLMTKDKAQILPKFLHIFFFLSLILGSLMKTIIFDTNNKPAFDMIRLMRTDAREYYLGEILYRRLTEFVYFIIPVILIGMIIGLSPLKALVLILELECFRFAGEWLHLFTYDKTGKILEKKTSFVLISIAAGFALAYALPLAGITIDFNAILFNIFAVLTIFALGILCFMYIWQYKRYTIIAKALLTKENIFDMEDFKGEMSFADVKLDEEKMTKEDLNSRIYEKKQGYEYLNAIFFKRHRRIMVTPVKIRVGIIAAAFLIITGIMLFVPMDKGKFIQQIERCTPVLVFIMYTMSTGERICKAMFYNCDVSLLRYGYYREGKVILSNFTSRLKRVVLLNIIPALVLCMGLIGLILISGSSNHIIPMIPVFLCILCLSCFFSIHHLFMYYVIQPYTAELRVKSPLFKFINGVIYIVSYICLQIKTSSYYFTLGVILVTILYMAAALVLTYRIAPKTFKLK